MGESHFIGITLRGVVLSFQDGCQWVPYHSESVLPVMTSRVTSLARSVKVVRVEPSLMRMPAVMLWWQLSSPMKRPTQFLSTVLPAMWASHHGRDLLTQEESLDDDSLGQHPTSISRAILNQNHIGELFLKFLLTEIRSHNKWLLLS